MSFIIDERVYQTGGVSVNIIYDITKLDLSGAKIQVKFDARKIGGVGTKFMVRHANSRYQAIDGAISPVMESSTEWTSHVYTADLSDDIIQNAKAFMVMTNGSMGTDKVELEITNVEIRTLEHIRINDSLFALKTYQMVKNGLGNTNNVGTGVILLSSEQIKPNTAEVGEVLLEEDTGKVFYYDGTEWREFV